MIAQYTILLLFAVIWGCDTSTPINRDTYRVAPKLTAKTTQCARPFNYASETTINSTENLMTKLTANPPSNWHVHIGGGWATTRIPSKYEHTEAKLIQEKLQTIIKYEIIKAEDSTPILHFKSCAPLINSTTVKDAIHVPTGRKSLDISYNKRLLINQALDGVAISASRPYDRHIETSDFFINEFITSDNNMPRQELTLITQHNNKMTLAVRHRQPPVPTITARGGGGEKADRLVLIISIIL